MLHLCEQEKGWSIAELVVHTELVRSVKFDDVLTYIALEHVQLKQQHMA